jgi:hypothetical protein
MALEGVDASQARVLALTQVHRGHGVSTMAYYLGRALVAQGLRVLLVDLTGRGRLVALARRAPIKNLVPWGPPVAHTPDVPRLLDMARRETAGKADVILLDIDAPVLECAGAYALGLDYVALVIEATEPALRAADRLAERFGQEGASARMGLIYGRVEGASVASLPTKSEGRELPVLGEYPADYLLAGGDAYSLKGNAPATPHQNYLDAMTRLARRLARLVPLVRVSSLVSIDRHLPPRHMDHQALA